MILVDGVKNLVHEILTKAETSAEDLVVEAETETARIISKKRAEARAEYVRIVEEAEKAATDEQKKILAKEELNLKTMLEFKKIEYLSQMYKIISDKCKVPEDKYPAYIENALLSSLKYLKSDSLILNCSAADRKFFTTDFIAELEKKSSRKVSLSNKDAEISQGIIITVPDGNVVFDCSLDYRLKQIWGEIKTLIASKLHELEEGYREK